jgi:hypothetical protein
MAVKKLREARRSALLEDAQETVNVEVYPVWKRAIAQL